MNMEFLKNLAAKNRVAFKRHTLLRMHQRNIHAVVAMDEMENWIWVITVYEPDKTKWERDFRKRRST